LLIQTLLTRFHSTDHHNRLQFSDWQKLRAFPWPILLAAVRDGGGVTCSSAGREDKLQMMMMMVVVVVVG